MCAIRRLLAPQLLHPITFHHHAEPFRINANATGKDIMPQNKSTFVHTPDEVGYLYDRLSVGTTLGDSLHLGYWDNADSEAPFSEAVDRLTDIMAEKLKIGCGSHVLDVGCGVGGPGVRIARLTGARVTGISVSREQIRLANSLAESAGLAERVVFQQENAMEMSFPAQSFDAAIALESMIHMPDRGQVLAQIYRSLQPGGRLVLTDFFERAPIPALKQVAVDRWGNNLMMTMVQAEDYPPLLRQAGLWFEEILDISEQTIQKSLNSSSTIEMARRFDTTEITDVPELGYLMVLAKRPGR